MQRILLIGLLIANLPMIQANTFEVATFGSGCFWCTEAIFARLEGVNHVQPGYSGGSIINPSYKEVCSGRTGHAEVIQFEFDPKVISYAQLLEVFFKTHNPTQLNRQGNDVGTQYRSVVYYHNEQQKKLAEEIIRKLDREEIWDEKIVTEISPFESFYKAEDYHDDYYSNNPNQGYCRYVIAPKVEKFERVFQSYLKQE